MILLANESCRVGEQDAALYLVETDETGPESLPLHAFAAGSGWDLHHPSAAGKVEPAMP